MTCRLIGGDNSRLLNGGRVKKIKTRKRSYLIIFIVGIQKDYSSIDVDSKFEKGGIMKIRDERMYYVYITYVNFVLI